MFTNLLILKSRVNLCKNFPSAHPISHILIYEYLIENIQNRNLNTLVILRSYKIFDNKA
jgi:hypothetical protein